MSRILIVVLSERGHINPMLTPCIHLKNDGHEVGFYAPRDISMILNPYQLAQVGTGKQQIHESRSNDDGSEFARNVRDPKWLAGFFKTILLEESESELEIMLETVTSFRPDIMVVDPILYQGPIIAEQLGIPWIGVSSSIYNVLPPDITTEMNEAIDEVSPARDSFLARHRVPGQFRSCEWVSPLMNILFTTEEFVGKPPDGVKLVGPSQPPSNRDGTVPFPWEKINELPIIYLSMGTIAFNQPDIYRTAIEAVKNKPVQLVLSIGKFDLGSLKVEIPENVLAFQWVPQMELLAKTRVFVTHGGANSIMESLVSGVPMLVSPQCFDQFYTAHFVTKSDCGLQLDLHSATPDECWSAIDSLIRNSKFTSNMHRVSAAYNSNDGAREAANLISLAARQPSRPS
jgi:zeaxanthin glucosyltransferase